MKHEISADWGTLLDQSPMTADMFLSAAKQAVEDRFPPGFTKDQPELAVQLIVAHMQCASRDWLTAGIGVAAQKIAKAIEESAWRMETAA